MLHPEAGHILLVKNPKDPGGSVYPFHDNCFEGLCGGPSIEKRWGAKAKDLADRDGMRARGPDYIAQALVDGGDDAFAARIILGGGVIHQTQLFPLIRAKFAAYMNGYIQDAGAGGSGSLYCAGIAP